MVASSLSHLQPRHDTFSDRVTVPSRAKCSENPGLNPEARKRQDDGVSSRRAGSDGYWIPRATQDGLHSRTCFTRKLAGWRFTRRAEWVAGVLQGKPALVMVRTTRANECRSTWHLGCGAFLVLFVDIVRWWLVLHKLHASESSRYRYSLSPVYGFLAWESFLLLASTSLVERLKPRNITGARWERQTASEGLCYPRASLGMGALFSGR